MVEKSEHVILSVKQSLEDAEALYQKWTESSGHSIAYVHLVDARRICHKIAGSSLTFGIDNIASVARLCEHVISQTLEGYGDEQALLSDASKQKISTLIQNLYISTKNTWKDLGVESMDIEQVSGAQGKSSGSKGHVHVLVAEDDPVMQSFIKRKLEFKGFSVSIAEDGEQVVAMAKELIPDVILMDGLMPKMDGFEALNIIKDNSATSDIAVFMLTALAEQENVADGILNGADGYFIKPFDMEDVISKIEESCRGR